VAVAAARTREEDAYMEPMREDWDDQSEGESWTMQRESIQRYWMPIERVKRIASRYVSGRVHQGIEVR
jgi:hypothetical protein